MVEQFPKILDKLYIISYTMHTRGPTMVKPRGKLLNLGSPDAWKTLSSDRLLHAEYKNNGVIQLLPETVFPSRYSLEDSSHS